MYRAGARRAPSVRQGATVRHGEGMGIHVIGFDDDQLLGVLGEAVSARRAVSATFLHTATNAYAWHGIDAELARLGLGQGHDPGP